MFVFYIYETWPYNEVSQHLARKHPRNLSPYYDKASTNSDQRFILVPGPTPFGLKAKQKYGMISEWTRITSRS
jgi:hypothetical protein